MRHVLDSALSAERLPDLLHGSRVPYVGPGPRVHPRDLTSAITSWRARLSGSCAKTSTASSSTTTPYRILHTPV
ncbi:hypothetical protein [Streptomyces sp. LUP30]|uniref:hypothetical protein n=1 Tax=Streptomyces sp. LUP30 TaxID=1890285 RepID=UPI000851AE34|nr:hypothetical protein [Streptomyces sp. LUP30]